MYKELKTLFGKSLAVNKNLPKNHFIRFEDLESKKPGDKGISAKDFESVLGKRLKKSKSEWDFIEADDL